jgi:general secretion pathway protein D
LLADERQQPLFDQLIEKLDSKGETNTRNEVIYLKHAAAKEVAPLISQLVSGQTAAAQKAGAGAVRPPGSPPPAPGAEAIIEDTGISTNEFSSLITILPDERSNAVVVSGTVDDIRLVRELVDRIDILLAQVRIEVIIAEVTLTDSDNTGLDALNLEVKTAQGGPTRITNFATRLAGWNITGGVIDPFAFNAEMLNVGERSNVKILSAPTIVTTHNKEATILVGTSQPIITGTTNYGSTIGVPGSTSTDTVTYKDIAIQLKVTPLIGDNGSIQLKIEQKVDDIFGNIEVNGNDQPIIGRREASSFVNVQDGQMIVLGGLQRTKNSNGRSKLGFLVEIPILSHLLGGRDKSVERTELLLFIRPHVIPADGGTADATSTINSLSNKDQINQYLSDPSKQPEEKLIENLE